MNKHTSMPTQQDLAAIARLNDIMQRAGQAANETAVRNTFADHATRKADNTICRNVADLALFETFLQSAGLLLGITM